jgi:hypothetical protein
MDWGWLWKPGWLVLVLGFSSSSPSSISAMI